MTRRLILFATIVLGSRPGLAVACSACYGQSDSPLAAGMNWGIFSLLGFIVLVLGGVAGFFVFLARRASAAKEEPFEPEMADFAPTAEAQSQPARFARTTMLRGTLLPRRRRHCSISEPVSLQPVPSAPHRDLSL